MSAVVSENASESMPGWQSVGKTLAVTDNPANLIPVIPTPDIPPSEPPSSCWRLRWLGHRSYWLVQLGAWGGVIVAQLVWVMSAPEHQRLLELSHVSLFAGLGIVVTHLLRVIILVYRLWDQSWKSILLRLCPWLFAAATAQTGPMVFVISFTGEGTNGVRLQAKGGLESCIADMWLSSLAVIVCWTAVYYALHTYRRYQLGQLDRLRLDAAVKDAELRALKSQINPHFLFNSLNTLRALISRDQPRPREAVTLLADLLRASLAAGHQETIPLAVELETVSNFIKIEQLRYGSRLIFQQEIDQATLQCLVPPFLLQTLAENAVKHGIAQRVAGGTVVIAARLEADMLHLRVTNPGHLASQHDTPGLGLANARARLALLFGPTARLTLHKNEPDEVIAEAWIPVTKPLDIRSTLPAPPKPAP